MAKGKKTGGRRKGTPNRVTGEIKAMVVEALQNVGGTAYLEAQAKQNPTAFLTLVGKALPLQVSGEGGGPIVVSWQADES